MNYDSSDRIPWSKFARKLYSSGTLIEFSLFFASLIGYMIQFKFKSDGAVYFMASMLLLLFLYYLIVAFRKLGEDANMTERVFVKVQGIALSIAIGGFITAKLHHFLAFYLLLSGVIMMIICAIVTAIVMYKKASRYLNIISIARIIIIASLISGYVGSVNLEELKNPDLIQNEESTEEVR